MRIIHNGCAATTFGAKSLSISDREGREVFRTDDRKVETEEEVKAFLKAYIKEHKL